MKKKQQHVGATERASAAKANSTESLTFGEDLKNLRRQHFHYQAALASVCACSVAHISSLESGKRFPSPRMLAKLERAFRLEHVGRPEIAELLEKAREAVVDRYFSGSPGDQSLTA